MAGWEQFGRREWSVLGDAPMAAAAAVALASEGGGRREADAMVRGWRAAAREFLQSPLIAELAARMDPEGRDEGGPPDYGPPPSYDQLLAEALALCEQAVALIVATSPADLEDYRGFVLRICEGVALANNEQGIFGVGGDAMSRDERGTLRLIARSLGYGRPEA